MAVRIRLRRTGKKKQPQYRLVVAEAAGPRDGRFLETIGQYNPRVDPPAISVDQERALWWLRHGARPSDTAKSLLVRAGVWEQFSGEAPVTPAPRETPPQEMAAEAPVAPPPSEMPAQAPAAEEPVTPPPSEALPQETTAEEPVTPAPSEALPQETTGEEPVTPAPSEALPQETTSEEPEPVPAQEPEETKAVQETEITE